MGRVLSIVLVLGLVFVLVAPVLLAAGAIVAPFFYVRSAPVVAHEVVQTPGGFIAGQHPVGEITVHSNHSGSGFSVLFVGILGLAFLIGCVFVVWLLIVLLRGGGSSRVGSAEEIKLMQELHHGLAKLEDRVDSLETLVLDSRK